MRWTRLSLPTLAFLSAPLAAQTELAPPRDYALTNVRIVIAPGRVVEQGTVLVRNGRIAAAGAAVTVPPGVAVLDLTGLTVYPGLIDAANSVGLPRVVAEGRGGRGAAPAAAAAGPSQPPPELNPGRAAADVFAATEGDLDGLRSAGITTVGLAFDGGIFPGRVSAVNLTGGDVAGMVVKSPVAQQVALGQRRGGYPSTGMGAIAYVRQSFWDAQWDQRAAEAFQGNPAAAQRPGYDPEHRALQPAATGAMPVWYAATSERDLRRIIGLAAETGVRDYVLVGAQEGYRTVDALKAAARPVIVGLSYPGLDRVSGRAFELHVAPISGTDPAGAEADSVVARALRANAATLAAAGIAIAFSGQGLTPAQFRLGIAGVIEAGLPADEALRAATLTPARLLGLEAALGSVEPGKLANLVVVQGDIFSRDAKIRHVFIEGLRFDIPEAAERGAGGRSGRGGGEGGGAAAGEWVGEMEGPNGTMSFTLTLRAEGSALTGQLVTEMGPVELRGEQDGAEVSLRGTATPPGMNAIEIAITASISENQLQGTLDAAGMATVPFNARRRGPGIPAPQPSETRTTGTGGRP